VFQRILVGVDHGPGSADALRLAADLAALDPATGLTLVHAYAPSPGRFGRRGKAEELDNALHGEGMKLLEGLRDTLPDAVRDRAELLSVPVASAAYALHDLAEGTEADLIVIGPAQHGPVGRLLLGSDSTGIVHGAPCPVAIPPREHDRHAHSADATRAISPIGVGYDGSGVSEDALTLATGLARAKGSRLEVIGATGLPVWPTVGLPDGPVPAAVLDPREIEELARESVEARVAEIDDDVRADAVVLVGDPAESLIDRSSELHLLVVGSRDFGPVRHVILGSVSRRVLDRAECPVIVVPRGAHRDEG